MKLHTLCMFENMWRIVFNVIICGLLAVRLVVCYNLDTDKTRVFKGPQGSKFGYSVAMFFHTGQTTRPVSVLAGAPMLERFNLTGHGGMYKLNPQNASAEPELMTNIVDHMCSRIRRMDGNLSRCEEKQYLGFTIAVNPKTNWKGVPAASVCAPLWKSVLTEFRPRVHQVYPVGRCFHLDQDLEQMGDCVADKELCFPFWAGRGTTVHPEYAFPYYGYAIGGFDMKYSKSGSYSVITGPGVLNNRGAFYSYNKKWKYEMKPPSESTLYLGFSIATGDFWVKDADIAAGIPNYHIRTGQKGHKGKVALFKGQNLVTTVQFGVAVSNKCDDFVELIPSDVFGIDKDQVGTKFGATVAAVDYDNDRREELLIGAPLYGCKRGKCPNEGRVFVYQNTHSMICGPVAVLSGSKVAYARFGTTIASAGDLNMDGYKDVAIGAPYETEEGLEGTGAVYIYHGGANSIETQYSQRIFGSRHAGKYAPLNAFGYSISGERDIDSNHYNDLVVGSYGSDAVMVLRTRPIVDMQRAYMNIEPNVILLNSSHLACAKSNGQLCVSIKLCFCYDWRGTGSSSGGQNNLEITYTIQADTLMKAKGARSRIEFSNGRDQLGPKNGFIKKGELMCLSDAEMNAYVKKVNGKVIPGDLWTVVRFEATFDLVPSNSSSPDIDPILNEEDRSNISKTVSFDIQCKNVSACTSDLSLDVDMTLINRGNDVKVNKSTVIIIDYTDELDMLITVTNHLNSSFRTNLSVEVGAKNVEKNSYGGSVDATCEVDKLLPKQQSRITCKADNKIDTGEDIILELKYDTSAEFLMPNENIEAMQKTVDVGIVTEQLNEDVDPTNNRFDFSFDVRMKVEIDIHPDNSESEKLRYKADQTSTRRLPLTHRYFLVNKGPSFLPQTEVYILVPISSDGKVLTEISKISGFCSREADTGKQKQTSTTMTPTVTTQGATIEVPTPARRKRDLGNSGPRVAQTTRNEDSRDRSEEIKEPQAQKDDDVSNAKIDCTTYTCENITCSVGKMGAGEEKTIEIKFDIIEKHIPNIENVREILFGSHAVVKDPYDYYPDKMVKVDHTLTAEKWTKLVIEPESIKKEINIWIIIGSVLGALFLLLIVILICWKCGFFERKRHKKVENWKKESLYRQKSSRTSQSQKSQRSSSVKSDKSKGGYSAIENEEKKDQL